MRKEFIILFLLTFFGLKTASAESYKFGPYPNYKGTEPVTGTILIPTTTDMVDVVDPWGGTHHIAGRGGQQIDFRVNWPVIANSYAEFESSEAAPFNAETGSILLTEIWARNLDPAAPDDVVPPSEAFAPGDIILPEPGIYIGRTGKTFLTGPPEEVPIEQLPSRLPGYDLRTISGSTGSVVYVTQAVVDASEFIIEAPSPFFLVDSFEEWQAKLGEEWPDVHISPLTLEEGTAYLLQLQKSFIEGEPYSPIAPDLPEFIPPEIYVYPGGNAPDPEDAGLVMVWGDSQTPDGEKASAWKFDYGDPDLSNCIITVTAIPPGPSGITRISLGMKDVNGNIRSWWWNVPAVIPYNVPTTVTIDTTMTGVAAANPPASGYASSSGFDLTQVQSILADENATWVSSVGAPAPGGGPVPKIWNYWNNLTVSPKLPGGGANSKWYVKYSQPPVEISDGLIRGWDEVSIYNNNNQNLPIMADDWKCEDERPITDIHWWGSFKGWTQPKLPPILPTAFHIGIWTDQPDPNPTPGIHGDGDWSHPLTLVWENFCDSSVWNFAGYDLDPRNPDNPDFQENEACFQWAQFLSQDEWFRQAPMADNQPNVYWVSISAIYASGTDFTDPDFYPWGWKTRPHHFNDDAVRIFKTTSGVWPPVIGSTLNMTDCDPIHIGNESWDLAFELTTNEPGYIDNPIPGDITGQGGNGDPDGKVDINDLALLASNWLRTSP